MRVAIKRAGKIEVYEIVYLRAEDDGDVKLLMPDSSLGLTVHGMSESDIEKATRELLYNGHVNLTMFESTSRW